MELIAAHEISDLDRALIDAAEAASVTAHAPYSNFRVGAAIRSVDGVVVSGCNVENSSYGVTFCAEVGAVMAAVRGRALPIVEIAVFGRLATAAANDPRHRTPVTPCGRCRQMLAEMAATHGRDIRILCSDANRDLALVGPLSEFLPASFDATLLDEPAVSGKHVGGRTERWSA